MSSSTLPPGQTRQAVCQPQPLANSGSAGQTSQPDSQDRASSGPTVWDGPSAERFRGSVWLEAKTASGETAGWLKESRGQPDRATQNISTVGGGTRNPSRGPRPRPHVVADTRQQRSSFKRIISLPSWCGGRLAARTPSAAVNACPGKAWRTRDHKTPAGGLVTEWSQKTSQGS
jgi:hypothetical protein